MKNTTKKFGLILLTAVFLISFSLYKSKLTYSSASHVVISEIQIGGSGGANDEFIELYNPTETAIDISTWSIQRQTVSGDFSRKNFVSPAVIPAKGYYLIAHNTYSNTMVAADMSHATFSMASTGVTVYLVNDQTTLATGNETGIVDKVAVGVSALNAETSAIAVMPANGESIERKANASSTTESMGTGGADELAGNGHDSDNNANDFVVRALSQPQNSSSPAEPSGTIVTPSAAATPTILLSPTPTTTPPSAENTIIINEVAWSGTKANSNHEWIELYNTTSSEVDLTGWTLTAIDGTPNITLAGSITGHGYFLLERSSDDTVSDIAADQIYTGALGDTGESLELRNSGGALIDTANSNGGSWPAGNAAEKNSMERINPSLPDTVNNWATNDGVTINGKDVNNEPLLGTPKSQNSVYVGNLTPTPTLSATPTKIPTSPTPTLTSTPTIIPTATPLPTQPLLPTVTASPSLTPAITPILTPTPSPVPDSVIIGSFVFHKKTVVCRLSFASKQFRFGWLWFPKIKCSPFHQF